MSGFAYTLVVTSCNRHELLRRTLLSFIECADVHPERTVVVEDSAAPKPPWIPQSYAALGDFHWVQHGARLGQGAAIDHGYELAENDYIFHLEDDWEFTRSGPILEDSRAILRCVNKISCVVLTAHERWLLRDDLYGFPLYRPSIGGLNPAYDGISFQPGLRRTCDYRQLGLKFAGLEKEFTIQELDDAVVEMRAGQLYRERGFFMASLGIAYVAHIGDENSVYLHGRKPAQ